jgi:hypothetical protein
LAVLSLIAGVWLVIIGMQPPNEQAAIVVPGLLLLLGVYWFANARSTFPGPPMGVMDKAQKEAIVAAELAVHEAVHVPIESAERKHD